MLHGCVIDGGRIEFVESRMRTRLAVIGLLMAGWLPVKGERLSSPNSIVTHDYPNYPPPVQLCAARTANILGAVTSDAYARL